MRFLYGDSAPFSLGYNFLATLEAFMTAATRIVQLETDSRALARQSEELAGGRVKGLEALDQFHNVVMRAVQDTAQKVQHLHALEYAQKVAQFASAYVDEHRRATLTASEREALQCRTENDRRMNEQRQQLESFLKVARLPVHATKVVMHLHADGKEVRHQMSALFDNPDGIQTSFTLGASKAPAWTSPRKVGEFTQGVELSVGVDKSWLRGTVTPKQVNVDDWVLTHFELSENVFALTIRRKLAEKESLHFVLQRTKQGLAGIVEHPGQPNADGLNGQLGANDIAALERVWAALRLACRDIIDQKEQLVTVSLDGNSVFEGGLVIPFVVRLVTMFAPTVREIAKRSPNEFELSLKQENEGGRREEVYLRKEQLVSRLQPLSAAGREIFAPLGLDTWVPGVTHIPPPVSARIPAPPPAPSQPAQAVQPSQPPPVPGSNRTLPQG